MKIALIQSYLGRPEKPVYPLGLCCLAAVIPEEHNIKIFDPNIYNEPYKELESNIKAFSPDLICLSLRNIDSTMRRDPFLYYKTLSPTINLCKQIVPNAKIVIGGSGFSMFASEIMERHKEIDFGVFREGEDTLPELLNSIDDPDLVKGIFFRNGRELVFTGERPLPEIKNLPRPRRDLLDLKPYLGDIDTIGVLSKRGCSLKCAYCTYPYLNGSEIRAREPEDVVDEIEELVKKYKVKDFIFVDPVFNIPKEHAEEICRSLIKRNLDVTWTAWINERNVDREFVKLALEAGCREFCFSSDGCSDVSLKELGKNFQRKHVEATLDFALDNPEMNVSYNFFLNPPGQTLEGFLWLVKFYIKAKKTLGSRLKGFCLGAPRIEPYTPIYKMALKSKMLNKDISLLPEKPEDLKKLFYVNKKTWYLDYVFILYRMARWLKSIIRPHRG